jgi:hypothetical protein
MTVQLHWKLIISTLLVTLADTSEAQINRVYEPILVSQTMMVSPHRVCHDGLFLYFKSAEHCQAENYPHIDCTKNFHIAPIRSAEQIHLITNPEDYITRFFHIELRYRYQEVDTVHDVILIDEPRTVSACEDRQIYLTENVTKRRPVETRDERILVTSLIEQARRSHDESFLLINTPIGNVDNSEALNFQNLWDSDLQLRHAMVRTPFCGDLGFHEVWSLSGEYTGSGARGLMPAPLQSMSQPLYIKEKRYVADQQTGDLEERFEFSCEPPQAEKD